jgi:hypothetical protein
LFVGCGAYLQSGGDKLEARQFLLKDADGKTRVSMEVGADNAVFLKFIDNAGKTALALGLSKKDSPGLVLLDPNEKVSGMFAIDESRTVPTLSLIGKGDAGSIVLSIRSGPLENKPGSPTISLRDSKDVPRASWSLEEDETALWMQDGQGNEQLSVGAREGVGAYLKLLDKAGKPILELPK